MRPPLLHCCRAWHLSDREANAWYLLDPHGDLYHQVSNEGLLGELDTRLLGMLIIGKLFNAALQRVTIPANERRPSLLYVDEAQNFTTETVAHLLAEARKFGLYLSLANQTLSQVTGGGYQANLVETILGNVRSLLLFRLGAPDAEKMVAYTRPELGERDLEDLPDHHVVARLLVHGRSISTFCAPHPCIAGSTVKSHCRE